MADDTIYRQAAIDALNEVSEHYTDKGREWYPHVNFMVEAIENLPSAQRTGRWIVDDEFIDCSSCRAEKWSRTPYESLVKRFRFCPNCGERLEVEE